MSFLGRCVDLTNYQIGDFTVQSLAGRDGASNPRWRMVCGACGVEQVMPHARVTAVLESRAPENLRCTNQACPLSRSQATQPETASEFRQRRRREQAERARAEAEAQRAADAQAAKAKAEQERIDGLRREYLQFWNHQVKTVAPLSGIVTFKRWQQLLPATREMVLARIKQEPDIWFKNL